MNRIVKDLMVIASGISDVMVPTGIENRLNQVKERFRNRLSGGEIDDAVTMVRDEGKRPLATAQNILRDLEVSDGDFYALVALLEMVKRSIHAGKKTAGTVHYVERAVEYDLGFSDRRVPGGIFVNKIDTVGFDGKHWYWIPTSGFKMSYSDESKFRYALSQELMSMMKASHIMEILRREINEPHQMAARNGGSMRKTADEMYWEVYDAANVTRNTGYRVGTTEIWYMKPDFFRDGSMGYDWLVSKGRLPDPNNLRATHIFLARISENNLGEIFKMMQGEEWSPAGEANALIRRRGLHHTSMSVGDVIQTGSKAFLVDGMGFKELPRVASMRAVADELVKVAKSLTANVSLLDYVLKDSEVAQLVDIVDKQTYDLAVEVYMKLSEDLRLSSAQNEAIFKLKRCVQRGATMQPEAHRNEIFKAAHLLGIKLPSMMF